MHAMIRIFLGAIVAVGCCKEYCSDDEIHTIFFEGYAASELETIKVVQRSRNSSNPEDSFYLGQPSGGQPAVIHLSNNLKSNKDYVITIENVQKNYFLTNIQTEQEDCNCGSGTYQRIKRYELNGAQVEDSDGAITLIK